MDAPRRGDTLTAHGKRGAARRVAAVLGALALLSAGCSAPDQQEEATLAAPIYHGVREPGEPWVVAVHYVRPGTTRLRLCTGSVIAPRVVLTAKHCVHDEATPDVWTPVDASLFTVSVGHDIVGGGIDFEVGVTAVHTTPGVYTRADALEGRDAAVLVLDGDVVFPGSPVTAKALAHAPPAVGEAVFIAGFGFTENDDLGLKFSATASVSAVDPGTITTTGSAWTCTGDSGGPALDRARDALVAITSIGPTGCAVPESFYTRVDVHTAWIDPLLPPGTGTGGASGSGAGGSGGPGAGGSVAGGAGGSAAAAAASSGDSGGCALAPRHASPAAALVGVGLALAALARWRQRGVARPRRTRAGHSASHTAPPTAPSTRAAPASDAQPE